MGNTYEDRLDSKLRRDRLRDAGHCINGASHPPPIRTKCIRCVATHRGCTVAKVRADLMLRELMWIARV